MYCLVLSVVLVTLLRPSASCIGPVQPGQITPGFSVDPNNAFIGGASQCNDLILYPLTDDRGDSYTFTYSDGAFGGTSHAIGSSVRVICTSGTSTQSATVYAYEQSRAAIGSNIQLTAQCALLNGTPAWTLNGRQWTIVDCRQF